MGEYNGDMIPVPLSPDMYARISPFVRIPEIFPRILEYKTATNVFARPQVPYNISPLPPEHIRKEYLCTLSCVQTEAA